MKQFIKHLHLIKSFTIACWKNESEYLKDFWVLIIDFIVKISITVIFWTSIFTRVGELPKWDMPALIVLSIFGTTSWALSDFFAGVWMLPEKILSGELNKYLYKPVNPLFAIILEEIQASECLKGILTSSILMIIVVFTFKLYITLFSVFLSILVLILGVLIISMFRCCVSLLSFWLENTGFLNQMVHIEDLSIERFPIDIFNKTIQYFLVWVVPIGFLATYPTKIFLNRTNKAGIIILIEIIVIIFWIILVSFIWRKGIKRYEAFGG